MQHILMITVKQINFLMLCFKEIVNCENFTMSSKVHKMCAYLVWIMSVISRKTILKYNFKSES